MSSILSSIFGSRNKHLPPGPHGLPVIGNLQDIPSTEQWKYFYEQSQKYSEYPQFLSPFLRLSRSRPCFCISEHFFNRVHRSCL